MAQLGEILLQEGMGSLAFGTVCLLYAAFAVAYYLGRWVLSARNVLVVCLLGVVLGALKFGLVLTMAGLADTAVIRDKVLSAAVHQAAAFPFAWVVVSTLYLRLVPARERTFRV